MRTPRGGESGQFGIWPCTAESHGTSRVVAPLGAGTRDRTAGSMGLSWCDLVSDGSKRMQAMQELQVQASLSDGAHVGVLLPQNGHEPDLVRLTELVQRTREMVRYVNDARDGVMLVRRASATDKLVTEALKGCRLLESEQFTLRQAAAEAHLRTQRRAGELLAT